MQLSYRIPESPALLPGRRPQVSGFRFHPPTHEVESTFPLRPVTCGL